MKNKLRKSIGILLSALMVATMVPVLPVAAASTNPFQDVKDADWFAESVEYVYDNGLMNGTSATTFEPQTTMSRAMIVTVLHRREKEVQAAPAQFKDVPAKTWFSQAVAWAAAEGIVNGYSTDIFGPSDDVTREQIATIMYRYAQKKGYDVTKRADLKGYSDNKSISNWASEALEWANAEELIKGYPDKTIGPSGKVTRAEVSTIYMRFSKKYDEESENINPPAEKMYTVTFDYNYDNKGAYKTVEVKEGNPVGAIAQPERSGYTFSGWFTEKEKGEKFDSDKAVTEDLTLYAQWTKSNAEGEDGAGDTPSAPAAKTYTVKFETNGGSTVADQTVKEGETVVMPDNPTKADEIFAGWYTDGDLTISYDFSSTVTKDIVLYAKWEKTTEDLIYLPIKATCNWGDEVLQVNEWNYDENGNNIQFSITGTMDEGVTTRTFAEDGFVLKAEAAFDYDEDQNPSEKYTTDYEYDENGIVIREVSFTEYAWDTEPVKYIVEYTYDAKGNILAEHSYNTSEHPQDKTISYVYDDDNKVIHFTLDGNVYDLVYDSHGNEILRKTDGWSSSHEWTYDEDDRVSNCIVTQKYDIKNVSLSPDIFNCTYEYDDNNNIVKIVEHENERSESETWTFEYKAFNKKDLPAKWTEPMGNGGYTHSWTDYYWRYLIRNI